MRRKKLLWIAPLAILGLAVFIFIGGEIVRLLWNWLLPSLFGWRLITFWEVGGILALCRILFGGFGGHRSIRSSMRHRMAEQMAEHWGSMSSEERERFRQGMGERCGFGQPNERKAQ